MSVRQLLQTYIRLSIKQIVFLKHRIIFLQYINRFLPRSREGEKS